MRFKNECVCEHVSDCVNIYEPRHGLLRWVTSWTDLVTQALQWRVFTLLRNKDIFYKDINLTCFIERMNCSNVVIQKVTNKSLKNSECVAKSNLATLHIFQSIGDVNWSRVTNSLRTTTEDARTYFRRFLLYLLYYFT